MEDALTYPAVSVALYLKYISDDIFSGAAKATNKVAGGIFRSVVLVTSRCC